MVRKILNLYRFTRSEQKSLILLCLLLVFINGINFFVKRVPAETYSQLIIPEQDDFSKKIPGVSGNELNSTTLIQQKKPDRKATIEINSSDSIAFLSLYGIGPVFAGRIIKYRNLLGGYYHCDQLLEVYGMDSLRYSGFRKSITVDPSGITRLNINTSSFKELLRHPYLDYEAVKKVVQYRDKTGPISAPSNLWRDSVLSVDLKTKILPYLKSR